MPPVMRILARGTGAVLGLTFVISGVVGLLAGSPLVALNGFGFVGICALSATLVFYSVALERIGLTVARNAASALVSVLGGSAVVMAVIFVVLLREARFRDEASTFGLHTAAGVFVLAVLFAVLTLLWRER